MSVSPTRSKSCPLLCSHHTNSSYSRSICIINKWITLCLAHNSKLPKIMVQFEWHLKDDNCGLHSYHLTTGLEDTLFIPPLNSLSMVEQRWESRQPVSKTQSWSPVMQSRQSLGLEARHREPRPQAYTWGSFFHTGILASRWVTKHQGLGISWAN